MSERERELAAILKAYSEVTERLKDAHERLNGEVAGLREELRRKNAELRRRERLAALGEMAAGLAHEVRNPLGGIALYASMLETEFADQPKPCSAARKISHGVRTLERLVSEILDFAQEDRLDRRTFLLELIIPDLELGARAWAEQHGAAVIIEPNVAAVRVFADPPRLRQVLLNLLVNAVQAAGQGGHVGLAAACGSTSRKDDAPVVIEVWDDGPGISREHAERIFDPFFTTKATGTGLGLAIVHRIVEAHGGSIRVANRRGGGARFLLHLPSEDHEARSKHAAA